MVNFARNRYFCHISSWKSNDFHEKVRIFCLFCWFPLSELYKGNPWQPTCLPRGRWRRSKHGGCWWFTAGKFWQGKPWKINGFAWFFMKISCFREFFAAKHRFRAKFTIIFAFQTQGHCFWYNKHIFHILRKYN